MTPEEILRFRDHLIAWFHANQRQLPWRQTSDPYHVWVSEVMLQQTQVKKVLPYYENFLRIFPDIQRLASADLGTVLKAWEKLGYYARARNLHKAARIMTQEMGGEIPAESHRKILIAGREFRRFQTTAPGFSAGSVVE